MRNRPLNWVTTALLLFQLSIGMQWQAANANMASLEPQASGLDQASGMDARHCHTHKHDCCGSLDCQCQGAQGSVVVAPPLASVVLFASFLLPLVNARLPVAHTNELFRPPIV